MRNVILTSLLLVSFVSLAQVPLERLDVDQTREDRLKIEIVPIVVVDASIVDVPAEEIEARLEVTLVPQVATVFSEVHEALNLLGLGYHQYTLYYGDHVHIMVCEEATVHAEQTCIHGDLGTIADIDTFVIDLYDNEAPPRGTVQLNVLLLEKGVAWRGVLGVAKSWYWGSLSVDRHWTNRACRAWALHSAWVIAHELGHCFGLKHNEDDTDNGLDLMISHYAHFDWVKDSNKAIVQTHFRHPPPAVSTRSALPALEFQF